MVAILVWLGGVTDREEMGDVSRDSHLTSETGHWSPVTHLTRGDGVTTRDRGEGRLEAGQEGLLQSIDPVLQRLQRDHAAAEAAPGPGPDCCT